MTAPNLFLLYVSDAEASTAFYAELFAIDPVFVTPRYVAFEVAPGVLFSLWSGLDGRDAAASTDPATPRTSEVGLMLEGGPERIDEVFAQWRGMGARVVEAPHDAVFGRTFVIADPDGNLVRVCPRD